MATIALGKQIIIHMFLLPLACKNYKAIFSTVCIAIATCEKHNSSLFFFLCNIPHSNAYLYYNTTFGSRKPYGMISWAPNCSSDMIDKVIWIIGY